MTTEPHDLSPTWFWPYLWKIVCRSFHGTMRWLEIGEAVVALAVHVVGYFAHEWKDHLEVLFVVLIGLLVLTFFCGLLIAAWALDKEKATALAALANDPARTVHLRTLNAFLSEAERYFHCINTSPAASSSFRVALKDAKAWNTKVTDFLRNTMFEQLDVYEDGDPIPSSTLGGGPMGDFFARKISALKTIIEKLQRTATDPDSKKKFIADGLAAFQESGTALKQAIYASDFDKQRWVHEFSNWFTEVTEFIKGNISIGTAGHFKMNLQPSPVKYHADPARSDCIHTIQVRLDRLAEIMKDY